MTGCSSSHPTTGPWEAPVSGRPWRMVAAAMSRMIASQPIARMAAASPGTKSAGSGWPGRHRPLVCCRTASRASDRTAPVIVWVVSPANRPPRSNSRKARSKSWSSTGIPKGVRRLKSIMATSAVPARSGRIAWEMANPIGLTAGLLAASNRGPDWPAGAMPGRFPGPPALGEERSGQQASAAGRAMRVPRGRMVPAGAARSGTAPAPGGRQAP